MGRGKSWSREESEAVAKAWKQVSEHTVSVREQNSKAFVGELYRRFIDLAPSDPDALDGRWTSRSQTAVKTQFDAIGDDVTKFNVVLSNVMEQAIRQGVTVREQLILRAAIGKHLQATAGNVNFDSVDSVESDWKLYGAWRILKTCQRFAPINWPTMRTSMQGQRHTENSDGGPSNQIPQSAGMENGNSGYSIPSPRNMQSGGTPMRTLASAALSMHLVGNGMPSMAPLPQASPNAHHVERKAHASGQRSGARTLGKRHAEDDLQGHGASKSHRTAGLEMLSPKSGTLELVAQAICTLGDALSEYNAITLFSRPDMQGRPEQKAFFQALAEKHAVKAKIDRDELVNEVRQKSGKTEGSNSFSE